MQLHASNQEDYLPLCLGLDIVILRKAEGVCYDFFYCFSWTHKINIKLVIHSLCQVSSCRFHFFCLLCQSFKLHHFVQFSFFWLQEELKECLSLCAVQKDIFPAQIWLQNKLQADFKQTSKGLQVVLQNTSNI